MKKFIMYQILSIALMLGFTSCFWGIRGNGKVVSSTRNVSTFSRISASAGMDVIINQDSVQLVKVVADENLQEIIVTEVEGDELKVYPKKGISYCKSKKVYVSIPLLKHVNASSGSNVKSSLFKTPDLEIGTSSGANVDLQVEVSGLRASASSGANIRLSGVCSTLELEGSSGANIKAENLAAKTASASSSSGAGLSMTVSEKIDARASSGGSIKVGGDPKEKNVEESSGGHVRFK